MNPITKPKEKPSDLSPTSDLPKSLPEHIQLSDKDNNFVKNFQEPPEGDLLTDSITPIFFAKNSSRSPILYRSRYWHLLALN